MCRCLFLSKQGARRNFNIVTLGLMRAGAAKNSFPARPFTVNSVFASFQLKTEKLARSYSFSFRKIADCVVPLVYLFYREL